MGDTLSTIHLIANDGAFLGRLNASAAQENADADPVTFAWNHRYQLCSAPTWAEKVDYWVANHPGDEGNGWATDQAVISDTDITARMQELLAAS